MPTGTNVKKSKEDRRNANKRKLSNIFIKKTLDNFLIIVSTMVGKWDVSTNKGTFQKNYSDKW